MNFWHQWLIELYWHGLVPFFWGMVCMFFLRRTSDLCKVLGFQSKKSEWQWWWAQEGKKQAAQIVAAAMRWEADGRCSKEELRKLVAEYKVTLQCITDGRDPFERITEAEYEKRKS